MLEGLIAICGDREDAEVKRVLIDDAILDSVRTLFQAQETAFRQGCMEIKYSGTWRADDDEIMTLPLPPAAAVFGDRLLGVSETSLGSVGARELADAGVRGLAITLGTGSVLAQKYYDSQTLRPGSFLMPGPDGRSFARPDASVLTFDRGLTCIVEKGLLKFKSLTALARLIDTKDMMREATFGEVVQFARHPLLQTADPDAFAKTANQVVRRLIHTIVANNALANQDIESLNAAATETGFPLNVEDNRIQMPSTPVEVKALMRFLNDDVYRGAISGAGYVANSKRQR